MTNPIFSAISSLLELSIDKLKCDLKPIEFMLKENKEGMYLTHNGIDSIFIFCDIKYKAFIPKKYDGWTVQFVEWDGESDFDFSEYTGNNND